MGKPHNNKRLSAKEAALDKARNERRKQAIARRTTGQFNDIPPGQRQKLLNNFERAKWRR